MKYTKNSILKIFLTLALLAINLEVLYGNSHEINESEWSLVAIEVQATRDISSENFKKNKESCDLDDLFVTTKPIYDHKDVLIAPQGSPVIATVTGQRRRSMRRSGSLIVEFKGVISLDGSIIPMESSLETVGKRSNISSKQVGINKVANNNRLSLGLTSGGVVAGTVGLPVAALVSGVGAYLNLSDGDRIARYANLSGLFSKNNIQHVYGPLAVVGGVLLASGLAAGVVLATMKGKKAVIKSGSAFVLLTEIQR